MSLFGAFKALENVLKVVTVTESLDRITESGSGEAVTGDEESAMKDQNKSGTVLEEIELEAKYLVKRVRELMREGNVRKLIIRDSKGKYLLEIPMTVGVIAGGVFVLYAPVMTALSMVAAAVTNVKIEIVRVDSGDEGKKGGEESEE